mmetsp:Transcript_3193/g.5540  ORF Transcript_3193/g.5540 Transcript_3193/m.5540 type:complete len:200 (+) Transcript_3193:3611-4210(+)
MVGPSLGRLASGICTFSYQSIYSSKFSNIFGATGCQIPMSGKTTGSAILDEMAGASDTYFSANMSKKFSMFSGDPPSQYWKDIMNERASCALSDGKYLRTFGRVLNIFNMPSSKDAPDSFFFFFMKLAIALLDCPSWAMENDPSLLSLMTSGMDGKTTQASSLSRSGSTAATTRSANSCTKISEPMKTLASSRSFLNIS